MQKEYAGGAGLVPLDLSDVQAHRGDTPVHLKLVGGRQETMFALYDYPVKISPVSLGELKGIPGITAGT